ncbi:hypothetical protein WJ47_27430 [Burkholderia ubonensis]|nr:hypothetical protein WJ47_27430 [Burkholderia ubonensis]
MYSLCTIPVPALIRCTSPGRMIDPLPMLSRCASAPSSTQVTISMSRCGCMPKPRVGAIRSSFSTRSAPNGGCASSQAPSIGKL